MKHPPPLPLIDYWEIHQDDFEFNQDSRSIMVFLHIQKTGGSTFSRHLVEDVDLEGGNSRDFIIFSVANLWIWHHIQG